MKFQIGDAVQFQHWGKEKYLVSGEVIGFKIDIAGRGIFKVKPFIVPKNHVGYLIDDHYEVDDTILKLVTKLEKALL